MDLAGEEIILQSKISTSEALASVDKVLSFLYFISNIIFKYFTLM
jgi:uncharacterized membrane protein